MALLIPPAQTDTDSIVFRNAKSHGPRRIKSKTIQLSDSAEGVPRN